MGIDKVIKNLSSIFKESKITKSHCEVLGEILKQLETKEKRIKSQIDTVSSRQKRKKLNLELKIVKLQLRKGYFKGKIEILVKLLKTRYDFSIRSKNFERLGQHNVIVVHVVAY